MSEPAGVNDVWQLAEAAARGPFAAENSELRALLREAADLLADALEARWTLRSAADARALLVRLRAVLPQDEPTP